MHDALIVGGDGQIGKALMAHLVSNGRDAICTTRKWPPVEALLRLKTVPYDLRWPTYLPEAEVTFFVTGINGFKPCEADPVEARRINVILLLQTATLVSYLGGRLVYLSSSAAETHPDTVYGQCKLEAESGFQRLGAAIYRFGPVAFPGRDVYANDTYSPMNLPMLCGILANLLDKWDPGLHCLYNRDWVAEHGEGITPRGGEIAGVI